MLTVWERRRLNSATFVPEAIHTGEGETKSESQRIYASLYSCVGGHILQLTIGIFQGLFLLGGLGDDLDSFTEKEPNVGTVPIQHLHRQHEVFPFV